MASMPLPAGNGPTATGVSVVAVTGATGAIGQFVVQRLLAEGLHVRAAMRETPLNIAAHPKLSQHRFDMRDPQTAGMFVDGAQALVHCAFSHIPGRYRGGEGQDAREFWQTNLGATLNLLEACAAANLRRAVVLSTRAVFGDDHRPNVFSDQSAMTPTTHYGAMKRAEESLTRLFSRPYADQTTGAHRLDPGFEASALRPTGVYGVLSAPESSKWYTECQNVMNGQPLSAVRASTEVHGQDVADAVWRLLCAPQGTTGGIAFNCSDLLVSSRMLGRMLNTLTGQHLALPELAEQTPTPMQCDGLRSLGWQPGGKERLVSTLQELLDQVNKSRNSASEPKQ